MVNESSSSQEWILGGERSVVPERCNRRGGRTSSGYASLVQGKIPDTTRHSDHMHPASHQLFLLLQISYRYPIDILQILSAIDLQTLSIHLLAVMGA